KAAIDTLAPRIRAHEQEVEAAKQRLIDRASALVHDRNAPRSVRELQQQWTALGEGGRGTDQRQWRAFRAACDAVFAGLDSESTEREVQSAAGVGQAAKIAADAEALLAAGDATPARRRELDAAWREHAGIDRALDARFRAASSALAEREAARARGARL